MLWCWLSNGAQLLLPHGDILFRINSENMNHIDSLVFWSARLKDPTHTTTQIRIIANWYRCLPWDLNLRSQCVKRRSHLMSYTARSLSSAKGKFTV
jgi:hypothetical protein